MENQYPEGVRHVTPHAGHETTFTDEDRKKTRRILYVFREICIHNLDVPSIDALGQEKYYSDNLKLIVSIANIDSLIMPPTLTQFYLVSIIACTR